jgi:trehalose 6-phosphate synthase
MDKKIIMRVDRIDPAKNIVNGFHAYSEMLNKHIELCGRVVFLAFLLSSRQTLSIYRHYRAQIVKTVDKINKKYGSNKWVPIRIFFDKDRTFVLSAMGFYDVLFVNPILDGMNLVAKEGPIVNQKKGVLVLSRTAGAYQ